MTAVISSFYATKFRRGILLVCVAHAMFFAALFLTYFWLKAGIESAGKDWPNPFHFGSLLMIFAMSMFTVCASVTAGISAYMVKFEDRDPPVRWMAIAVACWLVFMFLELVEWARLIFIVNLGLHTTFGQIFLALTAAHWMCAFVCAMWLAVVASNPHRRDPVAASLYSHFLNLLWLAMVLVLYLGNADLDGL